MNRIPHPAKFARGWLLVGVALIVLAAGLIMAWFAAAPALTRYVESDAFRAEMDEETSKALHLTGRFEALKCTGTWQVDTPRFAGSKGEKTIVSLEARGIRVIFNPWGIFLRRWQLDHIEIESAKVGIQVYEPKPEPKPLKPWYAIFLPDRAYLKEVVAQHADITWKLRGTTAGFHDTRLVVTPSGRDFEYRATGGTFRLPKIPSLNTQSLHLLVTKEKLTLYDLQLVPTGAAEGRLGLRATAGLKEDKRIGADLTFERVPVASWIPKSWDERFRGLATGKIHWEGENPKIESSHGEGEIRLDGARLAGAKILDQVATVTGREALKSLSFETFRASWKWRYPAGEIRDVAVEAKGVLRVEGWVAVDARKLSGLIELGVEREYLAWLPHATEEIFTRQRDGYWWTTVRLSGTLSAPREDLSERVKETIRESPGAMFSLLFRQAGQWLDHLFDD
jgi:hypothetical protein